LGKDRLQGWAIVKNISQLGKGGMRDLLDCYVGGTLEKALIRDIAI
jgi:hypothetical protein